MVTAAGRVPTGSQVAPERAIERSTPDAVTLAAPLTVTAHGSPGDVGEVAPLTEKDAGSQVQNPEGTAPAVVDPGPPGESLVVTGRLLLQPSRVGMSIPLPIMTPVASQADQRVTFTTRAFC